MCVVGAQSALAQIEKTELVLNPKDTHELASSFDIGLLFYMADGDMLSTKGFLGGSVSWNELKVTSSNAFVYNGRLIFNRASIKKQNYKVDITVRSRRHGLLLQDTLHIPHFTGFKLKNERPYVLPGEDLRLEIVAEYSNGKTYSSENDSRIDWNDFEYIVNGDSVDLRTYYVPFDPNGSRELKVEGYDYFNPSQRAETTLPVSYPDTWNLNFTGQSGRRGEDGQDGWFDSYPSNRHGKDGEHGIHGQDGSNINIIFRATPTDKDTLLEIFLVTDTTYRYLALSADQEFILNLNGGDGGRGGNGGEGIAGNVFMFSGSGGNGGDGGNGGNGGESVLFTDEFGQQFVDRFNVLNLGGQPGFGGFFGKAGKPSKKGDEQSKRKRNTKVGETPGVDGKMGNRGKEGLDGPPPILQIISTEELNGAFEMYQK